MTHETELLDQASALLTELVGFPTISSESNLALIDFAAERLRDCGAEVTLSHDPSGAKANLFATIGPPEDGGVVLSGHTDVVPVAGQDWSRPPFVAERVDGRIYGRGACDMKGFLACALAMAPGFAAARLARPVHFAFTYDEEVGCFGAPVLLAQLARNGPRPAIAIVGEPTEMRIIEGHKGCYEYRTELRGLEGHASLPDGGVNAIEYAARLIGAMLDIATELKHRAPEDSPFEPPYATLNVGTIAGGIARNVIPKDCCIEWEMRPVRASDARFVWERLDGYTREQLLPLMQARHVDAAVVHTTISEVAGLEPMPASEATALVRELTGGNSTGTVSFGTEAGLFQAEGIQTVVCGPGSIEQAHRPDEYVALEQLSACLQMLGRLPEQLRTR